MAENSKIQWCHHTFNPWRGCSKVSEGCKLCYAETLSGRNPKMLGIWGPNGTRVVASETAWKEPVKWNRWAADGTCYNCHGKSLRDTHGKCEVCNGTGNIGPYRARVFCASLADVFEDWNGQMSNSSGQLLSRIEGACEIITKMHEVRERLFKLIDATPNLDWLLLTKRPENIERMMKENQPPLHPSFNAQRSPEETNEDYARRLVRNYVVRPNLWLGVSVENQKAADERIPILLKTPAAVRFLSCEPLLGPLDLSEWMSEIEIDYGAVLGGSGIDWAIVGGESGPGARPFQIDWARSLIKQCKAADVACFFKQTGSKPYELASDGNAVRSWGEAKVRVNGEFVEIYLKDKKGGDLSELPEDLRVREFPNQKETA